MSGGREKAFELLPELAVRIEDDANSFALENPYALWIDINDLFEDAYDPPINDDLIRRIYEYAWWSLDTDDDEHEATAACYCFFEEFPASSRQIREDMPRWFTREDFEGLEAIFKYGRTEREHREFVNEFMRAKGER